MALEDEGEEPDVSTRRRTHGGRKRRKCPWKRKVEAVPESPYLGLMHGNATGDKNDRDRERERGEEVSEIYEITPTFSFTKLHQVVRKLMGI